MMRQNYSPDGDTAADIQLCCWTRGVHGDAILVPTDFFVVVTERKAVITVTVMGKLVIY